MSTSVRDFLQFAGVGSTIAEWLDKTNVYYWLEHQSYLRFLEAQRVEEQKRSIGDSTSVRGSIRAARGETFQRWPR